jgi:hypothetical protein
MRAYISMGIPKWMAYAWSRSRMGGWAVAQSPMMRTTVTNDRLKQAGYLCFNDYYHSISPVLMSRLIPDDYCESNSGWCEKCTGCRLAVGRLLDYALLFY